MYPYVLDKIADAGLGGQRYAVIIDEAHSSQGGDAAARLKQALGVNAAPMEDDEDPATYMTRVRGPQPNLSYFAFTATPKSSTLKLFGTWDPDKVNPRDPGARGMHVPFHVYSMKQAIEEGYILDVLANYITYDTKWRLRNAGRRAGRIGHRPTRGRRAEGQGEAGAVRRTAPDVAGAEGEADRRGLPGQHGGTAWRAGEGHGRDHGRQHAFDLYQAIRKWDQELPGCGFGVLVAFSGTLKDEHTKLEFTEAQLNGFAEGQLPDKFGYVKA